MKVGVGVALEVLEVTFAVGLRVEVGVGVGVEHLCSRERRINDARPRSPTSRVALTLVVGFLPHLLAHSMAAKFWHLHNYMTKVC